MSTLSSPFAGLNSVFLIGGGDLMLHAARAFQKHKLEVVAVFAPRHADEILPIDGRRTRDAFHEQGVTIKIVERMLPDGAWTEFLTDPGRTVALCFGPAWIFSDSVRSRFGLGMYNFNGIPIPRFLGGAHYTWQILCGDRTGGCVLQRITEEVDRGDILLAEYFNLPEDVRVPLDYFRANLAKGREFIDRLAADMTGGITFEPTPFSSVDGGRLYFPRLMTRENAFIDWSWGVRDIERFCCAFDDPYPGAGTFLNGEEIRLSNVRVEEEKFSAHPYVAGLIVRRVSNRILVGCRDGLLSVGKIRTQDGREMVELAREGWRLFTPGESLERGLTYRPMLAVTGSPNEGI